MTDRELMQQALEALDSDNPDIQLRAAIALRERLSQPEQKKDWQYVQQLNAFSYPSQWVGLTDKELEEFSDAELGSYDLCLEVEAKLKEKNGG
jgi:hypothetical protein